jgi:alginate export protein
MNVCLRARAGAVVVLALLLQFTASLAWSQTTADAGSTTQGSSVVRYFRDTFSFTGEFRSRWEGGLGTDFALTPRDSYLLTRIRLGLAFKPTPWLRFFAETQDARAMFYKVTPGTGVDNPFDWRQGWVELGVPEGPGVRLRVGRQDLTLGSGRLVGSGDWTNVTKTFNLARATIIQNGFKLDIFAGSVVAIDPARIDRAKPGEHFYGSYVTLDKILRGTAFEPTLS